MSIEITKDERAGIALILRDYLEADFAAASAIAGDRDTLDRAINHLIDMREKASNLLAKLEADAFS